MEDKKFFVHPSSYIDENATVGEVPARQIGWVCECGRRLDETLKCSCGRVYRLDGENLKKML